MKTQHTPGPWKVTDDGCIYFKDGFIGEAYDFNPGLYGEKQEEAPMMANARLMAAAPELLSTLQELYEAGLVMESIPFYTALKKAITLIEKLTAE